MNLTCQDFDFDDCEHKREKKLKNDKVDENKNLLCKHYKISKKEDLKVKFNTKLNTKIYFDDENNSVETIEKEKELIEKFQTFEQIDAKIDELLSQLKELPQRKFKEGYDVSYELDLIKHQAFILNRQKENIEKREKEIEKEKKNRKIEIENSIRKEQAAKINDMLKEEIFEYLKKTIDSKNVDIFFLFHCHDSTNFEFLRVFEKLDASICRHALAFYNYSKKIFKMINFDGEEIHQSNVDIMQLRQEILNLNWREDSICVVMNLTCYLDLEYKESFHKFIFHEDQIKQLLDFREIYFFFNSSAVISYSLMSDTILKSRNLRHVSRISLLKRSRLNSLDNVKEYLEKKKNPEDIFNLSSMIGELDRCFVIIFEKSSLLGPVSMKNEFNNWIKTSQGVLNISHNLYLINCLVNTWSGKKHFFWTEIYQSQEILNQNLDIHLTARFIVRVFNQRCTDLFKVPEIVQIKFKNFFIGAIKMSLDLKESKISLNQDIENFKKELDCLTHFSFELSNKHLILKDFRTIFVKDKILLTEPVIYSCIADRFGSSDLGLKAINAFRDEHECNRYCEKLKLTRFK